MRDAYADLQGVAARLVSRATRGLDLSSGALRLYSLLVLVGVGNARARDLTNVPTIAEFHLPIDLISEVCEVRRETVWRWAQELSEHISRDTGEITGAQLVARQDHKTSRLPAAAQMSVDARQAAKGGTKGRTPRVSDGMLWAVSLTGPRPGLSVSAAALQHEWRDLRADSLAAARHKNSAEGLRTAYAIKKRGLQQSLKDLRALEKEEIAIRWSVTPGFHTPHPLDMTVAAPVGSTLSAVWDVETVRTLAPRERGAAVDSAAHYLAALYGDTGSVGLYRWILWRLCRLDTIGADLWQPVLTVLARVQVSECRSAGAVIMHHLKTGGGGVSLWDHLKNAPAHRVGWAAS